MVCLRDIVSSLSDTYDTYPTVRVETKDLEDLWDLSNLASSPIRIGMPPRRNMAWNISEAKEDLLPIP